MAMDQERHAYRWGMVAQGFYCGHRLAPRADELIWVDEVSLVNPADTGKGAVDARVQIGTRHILLASLSADKPRVVLQTPVLPDKVFCFYVTPKGGHDSDSGSDGDANSDNDSDNDDRVAVLFRGIVHTLNEEEDEEAISSEDDDGEENHEQESEGTDKEGDDNAMSSDNEDTASNDEKDKEDNSEVVGRIGMPSGVSCHRRNFVPEAEGQSLGEAAPRFAVGMEPPVAAGAFSGIFAFVYVLMFVVLILFV